MDQYSFALVRTADVALTRSISQELRDRGLMLTPWPTTWKVSRCGAANAGCLGGIGAITLLVAAIGMQLHGDVYFERT